MSKASCIFDLRGYSSFLVNLKNGVYKRLMLFVRLAVSFLPRKNTD